MELLWQIFGGVAAIAFTFGGGYMAIRMNIAHNREELEANRAETQELKKLWHEHVKFCSDERRKEAEDRRKREEKESNDRREIYKKMEKQSEDIGKIRSAVSWVRGKMGYDGPEDF